MKENKKPTDNDDYTRQLEGIKRDLENSKKDLIKTKRSNLITGIIVFCCGAICLILIILHECGII